MDDAVNVFIRNRQILQMEKWVMRAILAEAFLIALWPAGATAALAFGIVFWLRRLQLDPEFHFRHLPFDVPIALFAVLSAVSILVSPDPAFSFYNYYNLVGVYVLTYLLVGQNIRTRDEVRKIVGAFGISALLVVLYGFYQYLFGIDTGEMRWVDGDAFPELRTRVFSTWENPNILAGYLDAAICVMLGVFDKTYGRNRRIFLAGGMVLLALCLAMTYARGAFLTIALILAVYGILRDRRVLIACLVGGILLLLADSTLYERLTSVYTKMDTSSEMRLAIWESSIAMIEDHPFFGIGWGAFWMVYPSYDFYLQGADVKLVHAHNIYLNYAVEIGIVGALAFFWYFFGTLRAAMTYQDEKMAEIREKAEEFRQKRWVIEGRIHDVMHLIDSKREAEAQRIAREQELQKKAEEAAAEAARIEAEKAQAARAKAESEEREMPAAGQPEKETESPAEEAGDEASDRQENPAEEKGTETDPAPVPSEEEDGKRGEAASSDEEENNPEQPETETAESEEPAGKVSDSTEPEKAPLADNESTEAAETAETENSSREENAAAGIRNPARPEPVTVQTAQDGRVNPAEVPAAAAVRQDEGESPAIRYLAEIAALEQQAAEYRQELKELDDQAKAAAPPTGQNVLEDLLKWDKHALCEGISLGIGIALISEALNGLTDDLLFNIPTSMLIWFLAALAAAIRQLPKEDPSGERRLFHEIPDHDIQGDH